VNSVKQRHTPIRSCVVCRQTSDKRELLRVVRLPERDGGLVVVDPTGKRAGRGSYVCPETACIEKAMKGKRFERSLAVQAGLVQQDLYEQLKSLAAARSESQMAQSRSEQSPVHVTGDPSATSIRSDQPMK
jgi:hypothetical protein